MSKKVVTKSALAIVLLILTAICVAAQTAPTVTSHLPIDDAIAHKILTGQINFTVGTDGSSNPLPANCTLYVDGNDAGLSQLSANGSYSITSNFTGSKKITWGVTCRDGTTNVSTANRTYYQATDQNFQEEKDMITLIPVLLALLGTAFLIGGLMKRDSWMFPMLGFIMFVAAAIISLNITSVVCETTNGVASCTTVEIASQQLAYPFVGIAILSLVLLALNVLYGFGKDEDPEQEE